MSTQLTRFNGIISDSLKSCPEFVEMRASVQLNATMGFADTIEAVTLTVQALKNNDRVVQRLFTFGNAVPWRPNEYMIRSD